MEFEEHPLLHFADLTLALLRASQDGAATLAQAAHALESVRRRAGEAATVDQAQLLAHLDRARRHLAAARLVQMLDERHFRITPRGRAALAEHPQGIDDTVLMAYPEFRAWMEGLFAHPPPEDARKGEFQRGWAACGEGRPQGDNPFPTDTAQHDAWHDGWLEANRQDHEGRR